MKTYPIITAKDYILIDTESGTLLVDTGCPLSFQEDGEIKICDESFSVISSISALGISLSPQYLTEKLGIHVSGLVGMDLLGRFSLEINAPAGVLVFGHPDDNWRRIPSSIKMGYATLEMTLEDKGATIILDTAAPISYVNPSYTQNLTQIGRKTDFWPMSQPDTFETPIFKLRASVADNDFDVQAGHLPGNGIKMLSLIGIGGVIGGDILKRGPVLLHDGGIWIRR